MHVHHHEVDPVLTESWAKRLAPFRQPDDRRSAWQLVSTSVLFAAAWAVTWASLSLPYVVTLALSVPAAFLLVRLFIIQHDCGHGSFFRSQRVANAVGGVLGVLTMTPYAYWRRTHAMHHAGSGNLEHRGFGDIDTWTVAEYESRTPWERAKYRVYRHPVALFLVGAVFHFVVRHRLPALASRDWPRERRSIFWTNVGMVAFVLGMAALVGWRAFLLVHTPIALASCSIGVWLFYVQHQFEPTYWEHDEHWAVRARSPAGQLVLRPASGAAMADGKHRSPPRASPERPDPELQAAGGARGVPGTEPRVPDHAVGEPPLRVAHAVGRGGAEARAVPEVVTTRYSRGHLATGRPDRQGRVGSEAGYAGRVGTPDSTV